MWNILTSRKSKRGTFLRTQILITVVALTNWFNPSNVCASDDVIPPSPSAPNATSISAADKLCQNRPIWNLAASIKSTEGDMPANRAAQRLSEFGILFDSIDDPRPWMIETYCEWDAPATRHLPLFFEEPNLERLGYLHRNFLNDCGYETNPVVAECVQPFVSAAHFFGRVPFIPYIAGIQPPLEPVYTLGVDRPGSPVVYRDYLIPLSLRGTIYEAGVVCGILFGIP